ncbi:MAG TPA: lysylphosphatidylglycerol synthase transmembrane domain-containing protein [Polyangiaceae bacterium]|nr:lysylphosphatidylglycerol synthase transmembrane domain-containing protein [Polyangiaceae bacterium]
MLKRYGARLAISLAIALVFAGLLRQADFGLLPPLHVIQDVQIWAVLGYFGLFSLVHVLRAARWKLLLDPLHPVSMSRILGASFVGFAAIVLLPMRAGEIVRPVLVRKKGAISGWAATGTIGAERVIDGLVLSLMLLFGLATARTLDPLPDHIGKLEVSTSRVPQFAYLALLLFGCAFVAMGLFYFKRQWSHRLLDRCVGIFSPRAARWLTVRVDQVTDGLHFLPNLRLSSSFVGLTIVYWCLNALATWVLALGCGFSDLSYSQACVATGTLALGILVPNAPGFVGAFQFSIFAAFAMFYPAEQLETQGAAYVFWVYVLQMAVTGLAALWGALLLRTGVSQVLSEGLDGQEPPEAPQPQREPEGTKITN